MEKEKVTNYERNVLKQCFKHTQNYYDSERLLTAEMFQDAGHKLLWTVFDTIASQEEDICVSTVTDTLKLSENQAYIDVFHDLINTPYHDEEKWKYHRSVIVGKFNETRLLEISNDIRDMIGEYPASEIVLKIEKDLSSMVISSDDHKTLKSSFASLVEDARNKASGATKPYLPTGDKRFDSIVASSRGNIVLLAAMKGAGKTKFSIHWAMGLLENNADVAVQWDTYEVSEIGILRNIVGREMNLTERQIQSRNYSLSQEEIDTMEALYEQYDNYDVEFNTRPKSIQDISNDFRRFCSTRTDKTNVLIIDNLGLISGVPGKSQVENDDYIAKKLVALRDATDGLIIVIHHTTKESQDKKRMVEGYRLRDSEIRGSTRIADYANQIILLNRPSLFPDLESAEKLRVKEELFDVFKNLIILDITKNRESKLGLVRYLEDLKYCKFKEWEK